jgi:secondary thiamine-phosphate synthase enzyme
MLSKIEFETKESHQLVDLREQVNELLKEQDIQSGLCYLYSPHTTGGLVVTSFYQDTLNDVIVETKNIVPTRLDYFHTIDGPLDAAGHIKSALFGVSQFFFIEDGEILLGHAQGILFYEFDGPREREVYVKFQKI